MAVSRLRIGIIGAGHAGTALGVGLSRAGYQVVAVASRTLASAKALAARIEGCRAWLSPQDVAAAASLIIIATPDDAIREVAASLTLDASKSVVHLSGVETREALSCAEKQGAATGSMHPLQTFADLQGRAGRLRGSVFGIEAEGQLFETLQDMALALGGVPIRLKSEDKALYHAAAVFASNYVVTIAKLARDLWLRFGQERSLALQALLPLMRGALDNLETQGLPGALTGPIARGDIETLKRHIEALDDRAPELLAVYLSLAAQTLPLALAKGGIKAEDATALRNLLASVEHRERTTRV